MKANPSPPRFSATILNWLLDDDWQTPAGDFEEAFHQMAVTEGEAIARRWYRRQMLLLIPGRLWEKARWGVIMTSENWKISVRSLRKRPVFSAINLGGLTVGMTASLLILLFILSERGFDSMHRHADDIVRVVEARSNAEGVVQNAAYTEPAFASAMLQDIPEVVDAVRLIGPNVVGRPTITTPHAQFYEHRFYFTGPSFFRVFDFPLISGDRASVLEGKYSVVMTRSAAQQYFATPDVVGRELEIERLGVFTVTGLMEDPPENSHLDFALLLSEDTMEDLTNEAAWFTTWDDVGLITYLQLVPDASLPRVSAKVRDAYALHQTRAEPGPADITLQPLRAIHFGSADILFEDNAREASASQIWILILIVVFLMGIAVINHANMATAASMSRTREVGLRKAIGANRSHIARMFLSETMVLVVLSMLASLGLAALLLPGFNQMMGRDLVLLGADGLSGAAIALVMIGVGLLAGAWPAFFLSRFEPVRAMQRRPESHQGTPRLRQALVAIQFCLSIGLILASFLVTDQMRFMRTADLGFSDEQVVVVDINSGAVRRQFMANIAAYEAVPGVRSVSASSRIPGDWKDIRRIELFDARRDASAAVESYFIGIDDGFLDTYDMRLVAGRNLSMDEGLDSLSVLINETAASNLGLGVGDRIEVLGSSLRASLSDTRFIPTVVGIVADFNFRSLHEPVAPMVLGFWSNPIQAIDYFSIKMQTDELQAALASLETVGKQFDPSRPWEVNFLDQQMASFYASETRLERLFSLATLLSILIACLGLFGLTAFTVARRTREIGIRKVMGASSSGIVLLVSREIVLIVALAFLVSTPIVIWSLNRWWLDGFAYRTDIQPSSILLTLVIALSCALFTVGMQAYRAARMDPVVALRYD